MARPFAGFRILPCWVESLWKKNQTYPTGIQQTAIDVFAAFNWGLSNKSLLEHGNTAESNNEERGWIINYSIELIACVITWKPGFRRMSEKPVEAMVETELLHI